MCDTCGGHAAGAAGVGSRGSDIHDPGRLDRGTRIVVVGKGGVGKSTLSALLARQLARQGLSVVAVDADEQRNLAVTLGLDPEVALSLVPVSEDAAYVEEKTGARPGAGAGGMLVLNPDTTDLIDRLSVLAPDGVRLVVMGGVRHAGGGCLCPETALISSAVAGMHLHEQDVVVMDTHAGVEHFGRALARGFDAAVVVVDPSFNAVQVGVESARRARELGIARVHLALNRTRTPEDLPRVRGYVEQLGALDFTSITALPYDELALVSEPSVDLLLEGSVLGVAVKELLAALWASEGRPIGVGV